MKIYKVFVYIYNIYVIYIFKKFILHINLQYLDELVVYILVLIFEMLVHTDQTLMSFLSVYVKLFTLLQLNTHYNYASQFEA